MQRHDRQMHAEPLDLARVKREASFALILDRYGIKALGDRAQRMALCPFHADTTPSCSIHLERNVFHCFGCNAKGSVLDFVAKMENLSIRDAAARVKEICGLRSDAPALRTDRAKKSETEQWRRSRSAPPASTVSAQTRPDAPVPVGKRHWSRARSAAWPRVLQLRDHFAGLDLHSDPRRARRARGLRRPPGQR